jgi:carbon-monoxide dehydrogenase small subunit
MQPNVAQTLRFRLNGEEREIECSPSLTVWELIHDRLGLTGTKLGCSRAVCGSCSVLVDSVPKASCALFAFELEGADVVTIEGIAASGHPIVDAFASHSAFQCGYCTSGMIVVAKALLDREPEPDRRTIVEWVSSNVCRCTGYGLIVEAVEDAARACKR